MNRTLAPHPLPAPESGVSGASKTAPAAARRGEKAPVSATVEIEVGFPDLDPMAVAWHGHYLRYFEEARVALMRRIGYDYPDMQASGYTWPVIEVRLRYVRAARYAQRLAVTASLLEWENRLRIGYLVADAASGERLTSGYTIQCAVNKEGELQLVSPPVLRERLAPFL